MGVVFAFSKFSFASAPKSLAPVGTFLYSSALFVFCHIIFEISKYGDVCTNQDNPTIYGFLKTRVGPGAQLIEAFPRQ